MSPMLKSLKLLVLGGLLCATPWVVMAQEAPQTTPNDAMQAQADNTRQNKNETQTAEKQTNSPADLDLAKNVRHALTEDKSLSTYAHNVKVIAQNGTVTLKGPVKSEEEKQAVAAKAAEVAGQSNVVNELTVAPPK